MPYILVKGFIDSKTPYAYVYGLKTLDIQQLNRFKTRPFNDFAIAFDQHPCVVLTALEVLGYKVVTSTVSKHDEYLWTMRREFSDPEPEKKTIEEAEEL